VRRVAPRGLHCEIIAIVLAAALIAWLAYVVAGAPPVWAESAIDVALSLILLAALAAALWYQRGLESMFFIALAPFLLNMASLVLGWRWERTASITLALTSAAAVAWGVAMNFEPGVWALFTVLLIGPMMTASVLFWMARRGEIAMELQFAAQPELVLAPSDKMAA